MSDRDALSRELSSHHASNRARQRFVFTVLACVTFPAVVVVSFLPQESKSILHTRGKYHSLGHFVAFTVVAFVAAKVGRSLKARILLFAASLILGLGIEIGEHLAFRGGIEWKDVLVDAAGVVAGTLAAILVSDD